MDPVKPVISAIIINYYIYYKYEYSGRNRRPHGPDRSLFHKTGISDDSTRQVATRAIDGRMQSGYMATAFRTASLVHPPFNENSFPRSGGSKKAKNPPNRAFLQNNTWFLFPKKCKFAENYLTESVPMP